MKFEQFAKEMTGKFGEAVKPYLEKLYREEMVSLNLKADEKGIAELKDVWKAQEINAKIGVPSADEITGVDYAKRAEFRQQVHDARPYRDRFKHVVTVENNEEARIISITGGKEAQYTLEFRKGVESKERAAMQEAMQNGMFVKKDETFYFFKKFDYPIGYNEGKPTNWMRVEVTGGNDKTFHGFPSSLEQVKAKLPKFKE